MIIDRTGNYNMYVKEVDDEKLKEFNNYYYLYEYSDSIQLISDDFQYPSMLNYVKTGILTDEEMIQALLYKWVRNGKEVV